MKKLDDIKTKWDLTLLYKNSKDHKLEKDIKHFEKLCISFEKKYRSNDKYLKTNGELLKAMVDYEKIMETPMNPLLYWYLKSLLNSNNIKAQRNLNLTEERYQNATNRILFFELNLGKVDDKRKEKILNCRRLKKYRYFFENLFKHAKYTLSEKEEKVISKMFLPASTMWQQGLKKSLLKQTVKCNHKVMPILNASQVIHELPTKQRRTLQQKLTKTYIELSDFAESELNAIYTTKKINDELRGFKKPYESKIIANENDVKVVETLVEVVTQNFELSHRFYELKAKLLNLNKLRYEDRAAKVKELSTKYSYKDAYYIIKNTLNNIDKDFSNILYDFSQGKIDVYPKRGKSLDSQISLPNTKSFILLNFDNSFNHVTTFAHELGHGIHSTLTQRNQPAIYQDYSTTAAETASTFFEGIIFDQLTKDLPNDQKIIALHNKIQEDIQSIFRQIACFNFETEAHNRLRNEGIISKEDFTDMMNKHMHNYLGKTFELRETDGYQWVSWTHLRSPFYVYTYAYGQLVSSALRQIYYDDNKFIVKIKEFLKAGSSNTVENIFKSVGISVNKKFFENGLKAIKQDINTLEELIKISKRLF